jgi:hypothetical protein
MTTPTVAEVGHGSTEEPVVSSTGSPRRQAFARFKQLAIVTVFVGGAAMAYGGAPSDAYTAALALRPLSPEKRWGLEAHGRRILLPAAGLPTPPTLFNQTFRFEQDTNGHALHVWAWLRNPNGLTNPENPNVDTTYCP